MGEMANQVPPEARVGARHEIFEDTEYFKQGKICPDCNKEFIINALKNKFSRGQAQEYFDSVLVCSACKDKDKIKAAAKQMGSR